LQLPLIKGLLCMCAAALADLEARMAAAKAEQASAQPQAQAAPAGGKVANGSHSVQGNSRPAGKLLAGSISVLWLSIQAAQRSWLHCDALSAASLIMVRCWGP
jgi:hypothetical protein